MKARAILFTGQNRVEVGEVEVPPPGDGEVLVEAEFTCVSPGTELRCLAGLQEGAPGGPFVPGYAMTGRVGECGPGVSLAPGAPVFCQGTARCGAARLWGGHIQLAVQPESAVLPLPEGLDLLEGSLAKLAGIACHGVRISRPLPHEGVAVVGLGPLGQLSARLHSLSGARVLAADRSPERVSTCRNAGVEAVAVAGSLADAFRPHFPGGADVVVDATGVPDLLAACVELAAAPPYDDNPRNQARLLVQGSYPGPFALQYMPAFRRELAIHFPRDTQPRDIRNALNHMARGRLQARDLISEVLPPDAAPDAYARLSTAKGALMTVAFRWRV